MFVYGSPRVAMEANMETYSILAVVVLVVILILVAIIKLRNDFVVLRNRVKDQAAQIDVQLKRRYDLIPNIVSVVKGQAGFEKSTLEAVVHARGLAAQSKSLPEALKTNDSLTGALHRLFAVAESYPELKANDGFLKLQSELSETENKIAYARQFYNDTVLKYNNAIQMFPASIVASICGFSEQAFLAIDAGEQENVQINADDFKFGAV
jgi:LemA protein